MSDSSFNYDKIHRLIYRGIEMGLLHVCAGPDHLSALATLSSNNSWRAVSLGIRWGLGHSAALVIVTIIFLILKGNMNLHAMERYANGFVGIFMILLGCHGVISAFKLRAEKNSKRNESSEEDVQEQLLSSADMEEQKSINQDEIELLEIDEYDINNTSTNNNKSSPSIKKKKVWYETVSMRDPLTQQIVAFSIGIVHGVAGPGGVLGVLPAVEMKDPSLSMIYLTSFVLTSTFCMGLFAALYGEVTKQLAMKADQMEFYLSCGSSSLSVVIGFLWLFLSLAGKLQDFFD